MTDVRDTYVSRLYGGVPRYLILNSGRYPSPRWWHTARFTRHLLDDAAAITGTELEALLAQGWRSRLTAAWLIGIDRRAPFRTRIGDLLLASEAPYAGGAYCFALARLDTPADAEILSTYLDRYLPRTDLDYDQPTALGALLRLDARLDTHHADRFTEPGGLWDRWTQAMHHLGRSPGTPAALHHWTDLQCDFADSWSPTRPDRRR
ncbi:hypothetical protein SUDANB120_04024 [Streptomyces sp. enrichment culture]|uniref:DUF6000 family protein n=1 Tax=Streptomyces sp. enrichment culture TaxID=1795815 RepID=UPI003F55DF1A